MTKGKMDDRGKEGRKREDEVPIFSRTDHQRAKVVETKRPNKKVTRLAKMSPSAFVNIFHICQHKNIKINKQIRY